MLVLSRQKEQEIIIVNEKDESKNIKIKIVDIRGDKVRIGIMAPVDIPVHRLEVYESIQREEPEPNGPGNRKRENGDDYRSTIGQFTGQKLFFAGKPNKKLYQGDIIMSSPMSDLNTKTISGVVIWNNDEAAWAVRFDISGVVLPLVQVMSNYRCRIIGNIHDDTKLLE